MVKTKRPSGDDFAQASESAAVQAHSHGSRLPQELDDRPPSGNVFCGGIEIKERKLASFSILAPFDEYTIHLSHQKSKRYFLAVKRDAVQHTCGAE